MRKVPNKPSAIPPLAPGSAIITLSDCKNLSLLVWCKKDEL